MEQRSLCLPLPHPSFSLLPAHALTVALTWYKTIIWAVEEDAIFWIVRISMTPVAIFLCCLVVSTTKFPNTVILTVTEDTLNVRYRGACQKKKKLSIFFSDGGTENLKINYFSSKHNPFPSWPSAACKPAWHVSSTCLALKTWTFRADKLWRLSRTSPWTIILKFLWYKYIFWPF